MHTVTMQGCMEEKKKKVSYFVKPGLQCMNIHLELGAKTKRSLEIIVFREWNIYVSFFLFSAEMVTADIVK